MAIVKRATPFLLGALGVFIAARALVSELTLWALLLLVISILILLVAIARPLFVKRGGKGRARAGLPSKYERVEDPWRALSAGRDPTDQ